MDDEYAEYQREVELELQEELLSQDPIYTRFLFVNFISKSKGKGRKRKKPSISEVTLYADTWEPEKPQRWYTPKTFPWDTKAAEGPLEHLNPDERESELRRRLEF